MSADTGAYETCEAGDDALSSTLWSGGRTRAWTTHCLVCAICGPRAERAAAALLAASRWTDSGPTT